MEIKQVKKHFKLLGLPVRDKITNKEGIVVSLSFDLYGCIQVLITTQGNAAQSHWIDVNRVTVLSKKVAMDRPDYTKHLISDGKKGPAIKPIQHSI